MGKKRVRTLDLFCGGGGSSRGAVMAGAIPVSALDCWKLATDTYHLNFPEATIFQMKAKHLSIKRLREEVRDIELLLASPECTNHSIAKGNKPICEDSRATAFEVIRFAKSLLPRWVVVENVIQMKQWHRFDEWYEELRKLGYHLDSGILDAQYYGTPQARRRYFVVGDLERQPSLPLPGKKTTKSVETIIGHGEGDTSWRFTPLITPTRAEATIERANRATKSLGKGVPFIMVYYGTDGAGGFQKMDRPLRTVTTVDRFAYVRKNGHGYEMRMLQPPELAAAMGFPDDHEWAHSTRRERIKLIGNAVCPPVMYAVVKELISGTR